MYKKLLFFLSAILYFTNSFSQNLLENDLKNWTIGSGSVSGFGQNGSSSENFRENGTGPYGNTVILWKAKPDSQNNGDGGWISTPHAIDNTKDYRFSVWIKKTNSNSGSTYFGCSTWNSGEILSLSGSVNNNPYFFYGDLPKLNKWYLLVGFVHKSSYSSSASLGGIYDPDTGAKVRNLTDFKFKNDATSTRHRSFLYYDTNTSDRQYFYEPRMEAVNGSEPSVQKLLGRALANKLVFIYDTAGNQEIRRAPNNTSGVPSSIEEEATEDIVAQTNEEETPEDKSALFEESIVIYPNPTSGNLNMQWNADYNHLIKKIIVSDLGSRQIPITYENGSREAWVDLTRNPTGIYLVNFLLTDGRSIQKKIIKK